MKKTWRALKKTVIAVIGLLVVILGIILIPLPGPGLLVVFAGLLILSIEFEWARKHRDNARSRLDKVMQKAKDKQK